MSITSFGFLLLVTIGVMVYYLLPPKLQWVELLIVSLLFYYYAATPYTIGYLVVSTVIAYASTMLISKLRNRTDCRPAVQLAITIIALVINILILHRLLRFIVLRRVIIFKSIFYSCAIGISHLSSKSLHLLCFFWRNQ